MEFEPGYYWIVNDGIDFKTGLPKVVKRIGEIFHLENDSNYINGRWMPSGTYVNLCGFVNPTCISEILSWQNVKFIKIEEPILDEE